MICWIYCSRGKKLEEDLFEAMATFLFRLAVAANFFSWLNILPKHPKDYSPIAMGYSTVTTVTHCIIIVKFSFFGTPFITFLAIPLAIKDGSSKLKNWTHVSKLMLLACWFYLNLRNNNTATFVNYLSSFILDQANTGYNWKNIVLNLLGSDWEF